jgi:hypothetical protein
MYTLGHLLSDIYFPALDKYAPIVAWQNPFNPKDYILTPRLASRYARERCYSSIADQMNIVVGDNGRCERDAGKLTSELYSKYAKALREDYSLERPAQPILFLDGTGGSLGRGICHGEMGCADFKKVGDSDTKQACARPHPPTTPPHTQPGAHVMQRCHLVALRRGDRVYNAQCCSLLWMRVTFG